MTPSSEVIIDAGMFWLVGISILILYLWSTINILKEHERGVVFRLGRLLPEAMGPGLVFIFWPVYRMVRVSLRTVTLEVPPQDIISRDNVSLKVNAIIYFRVMNAPRAIVEVENFSTQPRSSLKRPRAPCSARLIWTIC